MREKGRGIDKESEREIHKQKAGGMEGEHMFAEEFQTQAMSIALLRRRERRLTRISQVLAATLLLLLLMAAATLLVTFLLGKEGDAGEQHMAQPERLSLDGEEVYASARLTAPDVYNAVDYLEWQSAKGEAHCQGFNYSDGSLVVPASVRRATYRISLQITYGSIATATATCNGPVMILSYTVYVISDSYTMKRPLLSSDDTVNCSMRQWKKSLYTEGLFKLEAGSRIWVKSQNPELIIKKESLTFLSAELQKVHVN